VELTGDLRGELKGKPLVSGAAEGPLAVLTKPICFWGGIDLENGTVADPHHPQFGLELSDRIVAIPAIVGSSSSSQYLLELMRTGKAPKAILLGEPELILATAAIVGREMDWRPVPIVQCDLGRLPAAERVSVSEDGTIRAS